MKLSRHESGSSPYRASPRDTSSVCSPIRHDSMGIVDDAVEDGIGIDETWIKTNMAPLRRWGTRGQRIRGFAPHGHWRTLTFLGALRCDSFTAPCLFDDPINGECFRA